VCQFANTSLLLLQGWQSPGRGDLTLRLEEFVLANDGRYHRQDHMGYLIPAESLTLLEGFEEEATSLLARQAEAGALMARGAANPPAAVSVDASSSSTSFSSTDAGQSSLASATVGSIDGAAAAAGLQSPAPSPSAPPSAPPGAGAAALDPAAERVRRQMQQAYLRTQQLRTMIEWGRDAMGRYHQVRHPSVTG
jgi:hypothetical protein